MITIDSSDFKDKEVERNLKPIKLEIEKVRLFGELDSQLIRIRKNLPTSSKKGI